MCSLGDDNIEIENEKYMKKNISLTFNTKCNKCKEESPKVILNQIYAYCKNCFLKATVHKFKATLGKHHIINPKDRILIYYKPGHPTTALLHLLNSALNLSTPKKLFIQPVVIVIESNYDMELTERKKLLHDIYIEVKSYNFPVYFISLDQYIEDNSDINSLLTEDSDLIELVVKNDIKYKSEINYQDILNIFRRQLLLDVAKKLNCNSVFTTQIAVDIAAQLLTNISLGRGSQISLDTGICDTRDGKVQIIRPLRLFDIKELVFYNVFHKLNPITYTQLQSNLQDNVHSLMKNFVTDLQVNYPATVTTIVRTGDKLTFNSNGDKCILCNTPKENISTELNSFESTTFSHWISTERFNEQYNETNESKYCYSCKKIADYIVK